MSKLSSSQISDLVEKVETWNPLRSNDEESFTYIDLSAVDQDSKTITDFREIECSEAPSRARQIVKSGDVLVSTVRPNLNAVAVVADSLSGATASTGFCVLRPRQSVLHGRYLFNWVRCKSFIDDMIKKATGASYPAVSDRIILESTIPMPPLPEQRRIAAILDKADALRTKRRAALAQLDTLAQSIFSDEFGDPEFNRKKIRTTLLSNLCVRITDGTHQSPKWSDSGCPFLFVSNIVGGEISYDTERFISEETHAELTRRCPIEIGDVLYSTVGSYGVPAIVKSDRRFAFQRHIAHLKPNRSLLDPVFLKAMLDSQPIRKQADRAAKGVAQKTVNLSEINKFIVFSPPLALQQQFAQRIEVIEALKASHRASLAKLDALFASLQDRAFKGEL